MSLDPFFLEVVVCPETRQRLTLTTSETLRQLNGLAEKGKLKDRAGRVVDKMDAALRRADGEVAYPVRGDIATLVVDAAIPLHQLL